MSQHSINAPARNVQSTKRGRVSDEQLVGLSDHDFEDLLKAAAAPIRRRSLSSSENNLTSSVTVKGFNDCVSEPTTDAEEVVAARRHHERWEPVLTQLRKEVKVEEQLAEAKLLYEEQLREQLSLLPNSTGGMIDNYKSIPSLAPGSTGRRLGKSASHEGSSVSSTTLPTRFLSNRADSTPVEATITLPLTEGVDVYVTKNEKVNELEQTLRDSNVIDRASTLYPNAQRNYSPPVGAAGGQAMQSIGLQRPVSETGQESYVHHNISTVASDMPFIDDDATGGRSQHGPVVTKFADGAEFSALRQSNVLVVHQTQGSRGSPLETGNRSEAVEMTDMRERTVTHRFQGNYAADEGTDLHQAGNLTELGLCQPAPPCLANQFRPVDHLNPRIGVGLQSSVFAPPQRFSQPALRPYPPCAQTQLQNNASERGTTGKDSAGKRRRSDVVAARSVKSTQKSDDLPGHRGTQSLESLLEYIEGPQQKSKKKGGPEKPTSSTKSKTAGVPKRSSLSNASSPRSGIQDGTGSERGSSPTTDAPSHPRQGSADATLMSERGSDEADDSGSSKQSTPQQPGQVSLGGDDRKTRSVGEPEKADALLEVDECVQSEDEHIMQTSVQGGGKQGKKGRRKKRPHVEGRETHPSEDVEGEKFYSISSPPEPQSPTNELFVECSEIPIGSSESTPVSDTAAPHTHPLTGRDLIDVDAVFEQRDASPHLQLDEFKPVISKKHKKRDLVQSSSTGPSNNNPRFGGGRARGRPDERSMPVMQRSQTPPYTNALRSTQRRNSLEDITDISTDQLAPLNAPTSRRPPTVAAVSPRPRVSPGGVRPHQAPMLNEYIDAAMRTTAPVPVRGSMSLQTSRTTSPNRHHRAHHSPHRRPPPGPPVSAQTGCGASSPDLNHPFLASDFPDFSGAAEKIEAEAATPEADTSSSTIKTIAAASPALPPSGLSYAKAATAKQRPPTHSPVQPTPPVSDTIAPVSAPSLASHANPVVSPVSPRPTTTQPLEVATSTASSGSGTVEFLNSCLSPTGGALSPLMEFGISFGDIDSALLVNSSSPAAPAPPQPTPTSPPHASTGNTQRSPAVPASAAKQAPIAVNTSEPPASPVLTKSRSYSAARDLPGNSAAPKSSSKSPKTPLTQEEKMMQMMAEFANSAWSEFTKDDSAIVYGPGATSATPTPSE